MYDIQPADHSSTWVVAPGERSAIAALFYCFVKDIDNPIFNGLGRNEKRVLLILARDIFGQTP